MDAGEGARGLTIQSIAALSALLTLLSALAGCGSSGGSEETYLSEWKAIAEQHWTTSQRNNAASLPDTRGLPRTERMRILGERVIQDGSKFDPLVSKAEALRAPKGYEEHKVALVNLVEGTARLTKACGRAIQSGNRAESDAAGRAIDQHMIQAMDRLIASLKGLGLDASEYEGLRDGFAASSRG